MDTSNNDAGATPVHRFYQQRGIRNLALYTDTRDGVAAAFRFRGLPTTVLIDRDGNEVGSMAGAAEWDSPAALALIRRYLEG
jgi:hypothetical protein